MTITENKAICLHCKDVVISTIPTVMMPCQCGHLQIGGGNLDLIRLTKNGMKAAVGVDFTEASIMVFNE